MKLTSLTGPEFRNVQFWEYILKTGNKQKQGNEILYFVFFVYSVLTVLIYF